MGLKPPKELESWTDWLFDEYDIKGRKTPWFSISERRKIGNIIYMSILANSSKHAIGGINNNFLRFLLQLIFIPISRFEHFKLKRKWYAYAPELDFARYLRNKLFYNNYNSIR